MAPGVEPGYTDLQSVASPIGHATRRCKELIDRVLRAIAAYYKSEHPQAKRKGGSVQYILRLIGATLGGLLSACAGTTESQPPASASTLPYSLIPSASQLLHVDETHTYDVRWHILKVADLTFRVEAAYLAPTPAIIVSSRAQARGAVGALADFGGNSQTTITPETFLPSSYVWDNGKPKAMKRRYIEFFPEEGVARGLEIGPDWWSPDTHAVTRAHDPLSILMLLRVLDLPIGEEVRLDLVDGHRHRLCRITSLKDEKARLPDGEEILARRYGFRVDNLMDGKLTDASPETDMQSLVDLGPRRILLGTKGTMKGHNLSIRLVNYQSGSKKPPF